MMVSLQICSLDLASVFKQPDNVTVSRALDKGDLEVSQLTTSVDKIHEEQKNANILERLHLHDFNAEQSEASSESREVTGEWLLVLVGKRKCTGFSP